MLPSIFLVGFVALLGGCAVDNTAPRVASVTPSPVAAKPSATDPLLRSIRELRNMTPTALAAGKDVAREAFERDPVKFRRLRYLLALNVAPATAVDDDRLISVVEPLLNTFTDDNDLLIKTIAEQIREAALSRKKLRDEMASIRSRNANTAANSKRDDREPEMRTLRLRIQELEKQIAAMKSIDRSVTRR